MKKFFLGLLLIFFFSCIHTDKPPADIMTKQEMINFLIDLHIVEAKINILSVPPDTVKKFFPEIQDNLFEKHHITDSVYYKSYQYYLTHVDEMEEIYSAVVDSLSIRERVLNTNK